MLRYFAAALLPDDLTTRITECLSSLKMDHASCCTLPHVKVITKDGMDPYPKWEEVVARVAQNTKPFTLTFGKPQYLGEFLLAIPVHCPELIKAHTESVKEMFKLDAEALGRSADEASAFFEQQSVFTPYITLATGVFGGETFFGTNPNKRKVLKKVSKALGSLPSVTVSKLALYEAAVFDRVYECRGEVALGVTEAAVNREVTLPDVSFA